MGSYWSVPYLTKKSVVIEPAVKHETTEEKKVTVAESVKEIVANDMLNIEPFVELEEKRALTPIIEEKTQSIETQTDVVEPAVVEPVKAEPVVKAEPAAEVKPAVEAEPAVEVKPVVEAEVEVEKKAEVKPEVEVKVEVKPESAVEVKVEVKAELVDKPVVEAKAEPVVEAEPKVESLPDLSSAVTPPPNQFNSVSHAVKKSNKKNRKH